MKRRLALVLSLFMLFSNCIFSGFTTRAEAADNSPEETGEDSEWIIKHYVDDFGDEIEDGYMRGAFLGTFSNSATNGSDLAVLVDFTPHFATGSLSKYNIIDFKLIEYLSYPVTYYSSSELSIKIKVGDDVYEESFINFDDRSTLALISGGGFTSEVYDVFYEALLDGKDVRCVIEIDSDKYNFTVKGAGFSDTYQELCDIFGVDETVS